MLYQPVGTKVIAVINACDSFKNRLVKKLVSED
jgi:hypothetical protein